MRKISGKKIALLMCTVTILLALPFVQKFVSDGLEMILAFVGSLCIIAAIQFLNIDLFTPNWKDKDREYISNEFSMSEDTPGHIIVIVILMTLISMYSGIVGAIKLISTVITDQLDFAVFGYLAICIIDLIILKIVKEKPVKN